MKTIIPIQVSIQVRIQVRIQVMVNLSYPHLSTILPIIACKFSYNFAFNLPEFTYIYSKFAYILLEIAHRSKTFFRVVYKHLNT